MTPIAAEAQQAGGLFGGNSMWVMILIYAVIIGGIYFFLMPPGIGEDQGTSGMVRMFLPRGGANIL